ncbi:hypothetical protein THIOSC15_2670004 [uncultured Thiomicrorhabdus sp.]
MLDHLAPRPTKATRLSGAKLVYGTGENIMKSMRSCKHATELMSQKLDPN